MGQETFNYQLVDDGGASQAENVPLLIPVGGTFKHEYGTYRVDEHYIDKDGEIIPICERISKDHL